MAELIEEKLESEVSITNSLKLKTAYEYLNRLSFTVSGNSTKTLELLCSDAVCLFGASTITNIMLTKLAVHCLMPKKYGGLKNSKIFILDASNGTDVYQFVNFMKQYGLNVKKAMRKIMICRVFTVYQLTHFLKYELHAAVQKYGINIVVIPDLLSMFVQQPETDIDEVEFLMREIIDVIKTISIRGKVLLLTSLSLGSKSSPYHHKLTKSITEIFNKSIEIDKNITNDKLKIVLHEKQGKNYVAIRKYLSITQEDVLTVTR